MTMTTNWIEWHLKATELLRTATLETAGAEIGRLLEEIKPATIDDVGMAVLQLAMALADTALLLLDNYDDATRGELLDAVANAWRLAPPQAVADQEFARIVRGLDGENDSGPATV